MTKNRLFFLSGLLVMAYLFISWGVTGHRTIGKIAENHLTPAAKAAVHELLGNESLADASTWADEVRNDELYKHTAPWHYIDLPLGLSYADFQKKVEEKTQENVYSSLLQLEKVLWDKNASREKKAEALKFIVHFVGDLHQPLHVSGEGTKGGSDIQLNFRDSGTNLHTLWDTRLIARQGMTYEQLAEKVDHPSEAQIRQWQSDPLIKWIWESYTISTQLYGEVEAMKSRSIGDAYYEAHWPIIQQRLEQAGIRLAGLLNSLLKEGFVAGPGGTAGGGTSTSGSAASGGIDLSAAKTIDIHEAAHHIDETVKICSTVFGAKDMGSFTLVNLGAAYPDPLLTVVLRGKTKDAAAGLDGKTICVTGKLVLFKEKPEIIVTDPGQLK